jgi:hypothetical protein
VAPPRRDHPDNKLSRPLENGPTEFKHPNFMKNLSEESVASAYSISRGSAMRELRSVGSERTSCNTLS